MAYPDLALDLYMVGVAKKNVATEGGKVVIFCYSHQCKYGLMLFTSSAILAQYKS